VSSIGCNCGGVREGFVEVWRYQLAGQPAKEFATQVEANAERKANGDRGTLLRIVKRGA
jgi:hypothetical protein